MTTPRRRRRPVASARNDERSRIGQIRPTGGSGPWSGDGAAPLARPSTASAGGNRAFCFACGCSAGTFSSRMASSSARDISSMVRGAGRATASSVAVRKWHRQDERVGRAAERESTAERGDATIGAERRSGDRPATAVLRTAANDALVALSTALIWSAARRPAPRCSVLPHISPGRNCQSTISGLRPGDALRGVSAHMWTYLWTTSGSRQRGHTCSR